MFDKLAADGAYREYERPLSLYRQFVSSWDIDAIWYNPDGTSRIRKGEWHFGWIVGEMSV